MFRNQTSSTDENKTTHQDLSQKDDYAIEDIPIHTMKKDIQEIENPSLKKSLYLEKSMPKTQSPILNDKQQSSPFLNPAKRQTTTTIPESRPKSNPDYSQVNKAIQPTIGSINNTKSSLESKIFVFSIIIIIALSIGIGSYYFIHTRKTPTNKSSLTTDTQNVNTDKANSSETGQSATGASPRQIIDEKSINTLSIDINTINPDEFKKILERTNQNVIASGIKTPVKFLITDKQGNLIKFSDFTTISGITLSEKILSLLDKEFNLFILYDNNISSIGLVAKTSQPAALKNQLIQEEPQLYKELTTLLLYSNFTPSTIPFQDWKYKNYDVRYQNLISPQKLSIDYAIKENYLIIATSKPTIESLLDKVPTN